MFCKTINIHPIEARARAGEHFHARREKRYELEIPFPHLAACFPEWTHDGGEVAPCFVTEVADEGRTHEVLCGGVDEGKLRREAVIEVWIVGDGTADMEYDGF